MDCALAGAESQRGRPLNRVVRQQMKHRISAGAIVMDDNRLLMVNHVRPGSHDYWVAPGGGALGTEELRHTAARETLEETGLVVEPHSLAYIEEMASTHARQIKFWYLAQITGGALRTVPRTASGENIAGVRFLSREELRDKQIFPHVLTSDFWDHLSIGFAAPRHLGIKAVVTNEFAV
jgi:8-oxo-dGTP diphosphatase